VLKLFGHNHFWFSGLLIISIISGNYDFAIFQSHEKQMFLNNFELEFKNFMELVCTVSELSSNLGFVFFVFFLSYFDSIFFSPQFDFFSARTFRPSVLGITVNNIHSYRRKEANYTHFHKV